MKAIILTYAPICNSDCELLKTTKIFKLALNQHAENCCPDARIITDYNLKNISKNFSGKIISIRDKCIDDSARIEYPDIEFKGATILAAIDYLIYRNYDKILIVGDNTVNNDKFKTIVNEGIEKIKLYAEIYQYTNGNFNLPMKSISDFSKEE